MLETRAGDEVREINKVQEMRCNKLQDETSGSAGNEVLETNCRTKRIAGRNEGKYRKRGAGNELQEETRGNTGNEVLETNCRTKRIAGRNEGKYRKRGAGNKLQDEMRCWK